MSFSLATAAVCFVACHGGPADHFSTFAEALVEKGYRVAIYATGPAFKKFQDRNIEQVAFFSLENVSEKEAAIEVAKECAKAAIVITDVGHSFDIALQEALAVHASNAFRFAYYDNPESYVPGGYSSVAAKVMRAAQGVLFANANLTKTAVYEVPSEEICIPAEKRIGIGYYPVSHAEKIAKRRAAEREQIRAQFFAKRSLQDEGQTVLMYAGGNNEEYFSKAFPAFLQFLRKAASQTDLSRYIVLLQQHPGAKEKNLDKSQVLQWLDPSNEESKNCLGAPQFFISELTSEDAQVIADAVLYYQTSMGPQFVLAAIPTIQVGHAIYEDILVKNSLCFIATDADGLLSALAALQDAQPERGGESIREGLGIHSDWADRLDRALRL